MKPAAKSPLNFGKMKYTLNTMNNSSRAITRLRVRYAHDDHIHFARIVLSFHCSALSINTASMRCPCVASSSGRRSSGRPNSSIALVTASSSVSPAVLCCSTASRR